jgi:hypothetical protein
VVLTPVPLLCDVPDGNGHDSKQTEDHERIVPAPLNCPLVRQPQLAEALDGGELTVTPATYARLPMEDYAEAVSTERGRCFRFIRDDYGRATQCPQPIIATGWLEIGGEWHFVDSCGRHAAQIRERGSLTT